MLEAAEPGTLTVLVEGLLDGLHARTPLRAGSLIVTIFGDAVAPRGGILSLVSLLKLTAAFRLSDGLVRTALSRLVSDGWFERMKAGRNSFYRLTPWGRTVFARATDKIYHSTAPAWNGAFDLVLLSGEGRDALRAALVSAGFGQVAPDLMIAPAPTRAADLAPHALRLSAKPDSGASAKEWARRGWPTAEATSRYRRFLEIFASLETADLDSLTDLQALVVRVLLLHDFRLAVLKDPLLPADLLPDDWHGTTARKLCAAAYKRLAPGAERWLDRHGASEDGPLPPADMAFQRRFSDCQVNV